jgi:carbamoyltransferase
MFVIGLSGGPDLIHENQFGLSPNEAHDSACVLVENGEVICAIEEERLNRVKHTNKFPREALRACLSKGGLQLRDVDSIAFYSTREGLDSELKRVYLANSKATTLFDAKSFLQYLFRRSLQCDIDPDRLYFAHHHHAHAMSAFALSGFERSLILTIDGEGNRSSGMAFTGEGAALKQLADYPMSKSLGMFYINVIAYLGYKQFDEYKVMGLAPYGDPERYRTMFKTFYTLLPGGDYVIHYDRMGSLFPTCPPRRMWEPLTQTHKDIAASLQAVLEDIIFHVLRYYQSMTRLNHLCLAGGVAHNCTVNGKILSSGMFENVFVQPASHDAGAALGAAFLAYHKTRPKAGKVPQMKHVYWGTSVGDSQAILNQLKPWGELITYEKKHDIVETAAEILANNYVVGWVQGRSEFGPRALGNRSILADPRRAENKDRINEMVKKREGFRPFAPSVPEEDADEYFEVRPDKKPLAFMIFVVHVRKEKRAVLGAVTHVDGTARLQIVSRETNEIFWNLLQAFKNITGVPVLLNTSFNNNAEPIVESVEDAIVSYLTTKLDFLIIGDYLVNKRETEWRHYLSYKLSLPAYVSLHRINRFGSSSQPSSFHSIQNSYNSEFSLAVSPEMYEVLATANGGKSLNEIFGVIDGWSEQRSKEIVQELTELWSRRLVLLRPP